MHTHIHTHSRRTTGPTLNAVSRRRRGRAIPNRTARYSIHSSSALTMSGASPEQGKAELCQHDPSGSFCTLSSWSASVRHGLTDSQQMQAKPGNGKLRQGRQSGNAHAKAKELQRTWPGQDFACMGRRKFCIKCFYKRMCLERKISV